MRLIPFLIILVISQSCLKGSKYRIIDKYGTVYKTNEWKKIDNECILFMDNSRLGSGKGTPIKICGWWRIKKLQ